MINVKFRGVIVILTIVLGLIGCGSSSSTSSDSTIKVGTFVDSPVEGLKYETATLSGYTDNQGRFQYKTGETITFKIGNLKLGSARGSELMTPLTLTKESNLNDISNKATNIARILQSLDENSSNSGVIKIPTSLKDLNVSNIDLESEVDLDTILQKAKNITSQDYVLKDAITVKLNMKKYIELYQKYNLINSIYHTNTGVRYYLLNIPKETVVLLSHFGSRSFETSLALSGKNGITIYDINQNIVTRHDNKLYAGIYILKVEHDSIENSTIAVNFPELVDQTSFEKILDKTYKGNGVKYYSLHLDSDKNIEFSYDTGLAGNRYPAYIYDKNLNFIDNLHGVKNLSKGDYVIYFDHGATDTTGKSFTVHIY